MKLQDSYQLPPDKEALRRKARRLEWWTLGWMGSVVVVVGVTMGSSQAMRTAWAEDLLSLVPPLAYLVASRVQGREPSQRFPYGYRRAMTISFLLAAFALFVFGAILFLNAAHSLLRREHPTVGAVEIGGRVLWEGWLMVAALVYSTLPPLVLGRRKLKLAGELHDKTLHADASMNKADWLTGTAGIAGVLGIGMGWWWADAVAAAVISLDVLHDGVVNLRRVIEDLMDRRPQTVEGKEPHPVVDEVRRELEAIPWVKSAEVRLREDGHVLTGEAFLTVADPRQRDLPVDLALAADLARGVDWRLHEVVVTVVPDLRQQRGDPPATAGDPAGRPRGAASRGGDEPASPLRR